MSKGKVHLQRDARGDGARFSRCGGFELPKGLPAHDPLRDRLTTDESAVTCDVCGDDLAAHVDAVVSTAKGEARPFRSRWGLDPTRIGNRKAIPIRERDLEESPRFATWRSAVRAYIRAQDDGVPIKSVSDPARFEALPQGQSLTHEGDAAQRQVHRLGEVGAALDGAFPFDFVVHTSPELRVLPAAWCFEVLVQRVVGRPFQRNPANPLEPRKQTKPGKGETQRVAQEEFRGAVRKKSWITERGELDSEEYAKGLTGALGWEVTVGDLGRIERAGGRRIEDELYRRGLVLLRDKGLLQREDEIVSEDIIRGWKAIAEFVGVHEQTARITLTTWDPPIPVTKFGGRIEAKRSELTAWREKHEKKLRGAA